MKKQQQQQQIKEPITEKMIVLKNPRILSFYDKYPSLSPEAMNLLLIDLLEKLNTNLSNNINNSINNDILTSVALLQNNVKSIENKLATNNDTLSLKFHEINKDLLLNIKDSMNVSLTGSNDKVDKIVEDKFKTYFSNMQELIPKNNTALSKEVNELLNKYKIEIKESVSNNSLDKIEQKLQAIQQPLYNFITSNHEQLTTQITHLRDTTTKSASSQEKTQGELEDFLNKFKTSSSLKGQFSENMMETVLNNTYPSAEIINVTSTKASGDFILKRANSTPILLENKNYEINVNSEEIKKFIRDVKEQQIHGIFMSQYSGIVGKQNYQIEIYDGNIGVYLHNVEYNHEKVKTAIDIIDNLAYKLKDFKIDEKNGVNIDKEVLESINNEFQIFINKKEALVLSIKEMNKKLVSQVDELKMPDLQLYLSGKFGSLINNNFKCEICGEEFTKKSSLASHKKVHKNK